MQKTKAASIVSLRIHPETFKAYKTRDYLKPTRNCKVPRDPVGYVLIDDSINQKTGKHMQHAGYHHDSKIGKAVLEHNIVTTHYINGDPEYPITLSLYVKREACQ